MCNKIILNIAVNFDDETVNKEDTGSNNDKKRAEVGLNSDIAHEDESVYEDEVDGWSDKNCVHSNIIESKHE